ncbi:hypothetical protein ACHAXT_006475 [Thalassiosira profunda]
MRKPRRRVSFTTTASTVAMPAFLATFWTEWGFHNRSRPAGKSKSTSNRSSTSMPIMPSTGSCDGSMCSCGKSVTMACSGPGKSKNSFPSANVPQQRETSFSSIRDWDCPTAPAEMPCFVMPDVLSSSVVSPLSTMKSKGPFP